MGLAINCEVSCSNDDAVDDGWGANRRCDEFSDSAIEVTVSKRPLEAPFPNDPVSPTSDAVVQAPLP
jgi:hypothetical protein